MRYSFNDEYELDEEGLPIIPTKFGHLRQNRNIRRILDGLAAIPYLFRGLPFALLYCGTAVLSGLVDHNKPAVSDFVWLYSLSHCLAFTMIVTGALVIFFGYFNISTPYRQNIQTVEARRQYYSRLDVVQFLIKEGYLLVYGGVFFLIFLLWLILAAVAKST